MYRPLRWASKKPLSSAITASRWRVLRPLGCGERIAVHRDRTPTPRGALRRSRTASRRGARPSRNLVGAHPADQGETAFEIWSGLRLSHRARRPLQAVAVGPTLQPTEDCLNAAKELHVSALSSWRVRSPIQSMWAEQSYQVVGDANRGGSGPPRSPTTAPRGRCRTQPRAVKGGRRDRRRRRFMKASASVMPSAICGVLGSPAGDFVQRTPGSRHGPGCQIGEATLGEGAQQVERRGALVVGLQESLWVGGASCLR